MVKTRDLILRMIERRGRVAASDLIEKLGISRQAINRHLNNLIRDGEIIRWGRSKITTVYLLNDPKIIKKFVGIEHKFKKRFKRDALSEESALEEIRTSVSSLNSLSQSDGDALHYAFTEMLNNAIDHSGSRFVDVDLRMNETRIVVEIRDWGIGAFENIRSKKSLDNEMDAIQDLLKGKQTTAPKYHSGEGIFFTSKLVDKFVLSCNGKCLTIDNKTIDDTFVESVRLKKGTLVHFEVDIPLRRDLMEIFKEYTNEDFSFDRSQIKVKLFDSNDSYISRSQAKRLLHSMERFRRVELDFTGVRTVGQAFADEVFRVFSEKHPLIEITYKGANEDVEFMIKRAL